MRLRLPHASAAFLILLFISAGCSPDESSRVGEDAVSPPNIVILFADDLGYGDLSAYGHPTIRTPNLDQLAREGVRMTSFYVGAPSCTPSRAALLTGRYPQRVGLPHVLGPDSENGIPVEEVTLAESLKAQGYRTQAIGKWHLGHSREEFMPTSNGFDHYFGLLYSNDMMPPWVQTEKPLELFEDLEAVEFPVDQNTLTTRYTERAVRFIGNSKEGPFFLYLAYSMPHVPIHTAKQFRGRSLAGLYGDVIETIDWSAGKVIQSLRENGLDDNTIVVFTSDNGPWLNMPPRMFEENIVHPWHAGSPGPLRGWKATTYEGGQRVPAIIRWPSQIPAGKVVPELVTTMDLYSTLLNSAGADIPQVHKVDGQTVTPVLKGTASLGEREFFYLSGNFLEGIRRGKWKLRISNQQFPVDFEGIVTELFDLEVDPSERFNVADDYPELVDELAERMSGFARELGNVQTYIKEAP